MPQSHNSTKSLLSVDADCNLIGYSWWMIRSLPVGDQAFGLSESVATSE